MCHFDKWLELSYFGTRNDELSVKNINFPSVCYISLLYLPTVSYRPQYMSYQKSTFPPILRVHFGPVIISLVARQPQVAALKKHTKSLQAKTDWERLGTRR